MMTAEPSPPNYEYGAFFEAVEELSELPHVTEEIFDDLLGAAHRDLLGNAEPEAAGALFERIKALYTNNEGTATNYRKAGVRALEFLESAADLLPYEVGTFLHAQVPPTEIERVQAARPAELLRVQEAIEHVIQRRTQLYSGYQGVVAAIIEGSYANGTFIPGVSDIDVVLVLASRNHPGMEHNGKWVHFLPDMRRALAMHTNRSIDATDIAIDNEPGVRSLTGDPDSTLHQSPAIIIAPDPTVRQTLIELLYQGTDGEHGTDGELMPDHTSYVGETALRIFRGQEGDQV